MQYASKKTICCFSGKRPQNFPKHSKKAKQTSFLCNFEQNILGNSVSKNGVNMQLQAPRCFVGNFQSYIHFLVIKVQYNEKDQIFQAE